MKPIDNLKEDHVLIQRMLTVLEGYVRDAQAGRSLSAPALRDAVDFVRRFADACHHGKEEQSLFPVLSGKSEAIAEGPVRVLESEHEIGRSCVRRLDAAIPGVEAGDPQASQEAAAAIAEYTRLLRQHIAKEEDVLFEIAQTIIAPEEAEALWQQFEAVEESMGADAHAHFHRLVEELERRAGIAQA